MPQLFCLLQEMPLRMRKQKVVTVGRSCQKSHQVGNDLKPFLEVLG